MAKADKDKTMQAQTPATNGNAPASTATAPAPEGDKEKGKRGRKPSKPIAIVYTAAKGETVLALAHPAKDAPKVVSAAEGRYTALGKLMDTGYAFSPLRVTADREEVPEWARKHVPTDAVLVGIADITATPW